MKSPGEMFLDAFHESDLDLYIDADPDDSRRIESANKAAAEYDKARAQLPEDVKAFVAEVEARFVDGRCVGHSAVMQTLDNVPRLIAIVREQGAQLRTFENDHCVVSCGKCSRHIVGIDQGLARCPWCEANELHDRLAKLEAALGYAVTQLEAANELLFEEEVRGEEDGVDDMRNWIHETRAGLLNEKGGA